MAKFISYRLGLTQRAKRTRGEFIGRFEIKRDVEREHRKRDLGKLLDVPHKRGRERERVSLPDVRILSTRGIVRNSVKLVSSKAPVRDSL